MQHSADRDAMLADVTLAVHTRICTFLLDDSGVCRVVLTPNGWPAPGADRCIGAQFVACLDTSTPEQLIGELRLGTNLLFTRSEAGRFVLLRTPPIIWVETRAPGAGLQRGDALPFPAVPPPRPPPARPMPTRASSPPMPMSRPYEPEPEPDLSEFLVSDPAIAVEDLVTFSEVTLTFPLYRPDGPDDAPPPSRAPAFSRGQRLR